jgi:hypothetical protein
MLRAEELRIGNWVLNYKDTPTQILEWSGNEAYLTQGRKAYGIKTSRPIELTEEWLMKFGFEWSIQHQAYHKKGFDYVIDFYETYPNMIGCVAFINKGNRNGEKLVVIKHAHQLQNLYFVLTGEELTLKIND